MSAPQTTITASAALDFGGLVLIAGSFTAWLPPIATSLAIIWYGIEIWESPVGLHWRLRWLHLFVRVGVWWRALWKKGSE